MFNRIIAFMAVVTTVLSSQTLVWANDPPPSDEPTNTETQAPSFEQRFSRELSSSVAHLSVYGISLLLKTGGTLAATEDFLANEKNVVLKEIQTTEQMNSFVFERESDQEKFIVQVDKKKYLPPPTDWIEKKFSIEITAFGTLFSDQQQIALFVLSEQGRNTLTNL